MQSISTVCVYCGASTHVDKIYKDAAKELGTTLALNDIQLVYGGGRLGLMGIVADAVLAHHGKAIGYMPQHLDEFEGGHNGLQELHIVDTMHTRKLKMSERADAFVILPGGFGTLDELFEVLTWRQLRLHTKPIILLNIQRYWDPLLKLIDHIIKQDFARLEHRALITPVDKVSQVLPTLYTLPDALDALSRTA